MVENFVSKLRDIYLPDRLVQTVDIGNILSAHVFVVVFLEDCNFCWVFYIVW